MKRLIEIFPDIPKSEVRRSRGEVLTHVKLILIKRGAVACTLFPSNDASSHQDILLPAPQVVLKALLQDRKAAENPKEVRAAAFSFSVRAWARLKALALLVLLLYTMPGDQAYLACSTH